MVFTRFSARSIISDDNVICNNPSLFQCPQIGDIGFAVLLVAFIILIWKTGCCNKERKNKTTGESNSKPEEDNLLSLPYPQPPSEMYEATKKLGPNSSTSTLVDPYLVTNDFDNSLISKDRSFKRMTIPEPVLKWRESVNHSALDLPEPIVAHQPSELTTTQLQDDDDDDDDDKKSPTSNSLDLLPASPPPPAYVRSPH